MNWSLLLPVFVRLYSFSSLQPPPPLLLLLRALWFPVQQPLQRAFFWTCYQFQRSTWPPEREQHLNDDNVDRSCGTDSVITAVLMTVQEYDVIDNLLIEAHLSSVGEVIPCSSDSQYTYDFNNRRAVQTFIFGMQLHRHKFLLTRGIVLPTKPCT